MRTPTCAAIAALLIAHASGQTTLVEEDWQTATSLGNNVQLNAQAPNPYPGWTYSDNAVRAYDNRNDVPDDSTVVEAHGKNQIVELNGDNSVIEYDLSHNWGATDEYLLKVEIAPSSWNGQNQRYVRPEIRQLDGTVLWSTAPDSSTAIPTLPIDGNNNYFGSLPDYPSELTFFFEIDASAFSTGAAGQPIKLRLDSSGQRSVYINKVSLILNPAADSTAPTPDPLTWEVVPNVSNFKDISMRVASATDDQYGVEYYFENETRGTNSGWQDSRDWAETDLDFGTTYTYHVRARDKSPNKNGVLNWSTSESATTDPEDLTPPAAPTWKTPPEVADYRSITMEANPVSDPSGVQYKFINVTNATDSGWRDTPAWTQKDLDPDTSYTYEVMARDTSQALNEGPASAQQGATTPTEPVGTLYITRFQDPLLGSGIDASNPNFNLGEWVVGGRAEDVHIRYNGSDGVPGDDDITETNSVVQFEYTSRTITLDIDHNWSQDDVFTLNFDSAPQAWSGQTQRIVRPSLRQQDGTELWTTDQNLPLLTASGDNTFGNSTWQEVADPFDPMAPTDQRLSFSYSIPASAFSAGAEGQPIALRFDSTGSRGLFIDNVHLSVTSGGTDPFADWSVLDGATGVTFEGDANGDGVQDGLAFLLGAANPNVDANGNLPAVSEDGSGGLVMTFNCLPTADRGAAQLRVAHSSDLGGGDPWAATVDQVPDADDAVPDNGVTFLVTPGSPTNAVTATIGAAEAAGGKLFGRLTATE